MGALSVIRFRTPVKEPEDLAFLFFAIALGIGYGALQIYSTSIIFLILIIIIWFFLSKRNEGVGKSFNLMIECNSEKSKGYFDKILSTLKNNCQEAEMIKIEKQDDSMMLFFKINFEKTNNLKFLIENLEKEFVGIKFSLYENKTID